MNGAGATNLFSLSLKRDDPLATVPGTCRWVMIERGDGKNDVSVPLMQIGGKARGSVRHS